MVVFLGAALALAIGDPSRAEPEKPDLPAGYEQADQAGERKQRARKKVVVPAVPQAKHEAKPNGDELFAKNPQLNAIVEQMREQLQPLFAAELTFAKAVCQPNAEQLQKMKVQASPELEKALRSFALQQAPMMGIQIGGGQAWGRGVPHQQPEASDILNLFESSASRIVAGVFPPETVALYQAEQLHREKFRARSGAMALVVHLDERFRLSQDQRDQLTDSIQQVWQREWQVYLQFMDNNPQFFPQVPDDSVVPHLTDVQAKQWRAMQRQSLGLSWQNLHNQQFFQGVKPEDDWFEKQNKKAAGVGEVINLFGVQVQGAVVEVVEDREEDQEE